MYGQERYADINRTLNSLLEQKKHLIAVHRGSWAGNVIQNTVAAYIAAIKMGADMVEADINSSTDGVLYSFHDGYEPEVFGVHKSIKTMDSAEIEGYKPINTASQKCARRISRLTEVLEFLPEDKLLNIDRAWDIFPKVLEVLDRYPGARHQVVLKAPLRAKAAFDALNAHPVKYMFMPICYSLADVDAALAYEGINVVGAEIIAPHADSELYQDEAIAAIHARGLYCWVNAINLGDAERDGLYAGLDDDISIINDPALGWGRLFDKHIDIIQTDWPALLYAYRTEVLGA